MIPVSIVIAVVIFAFFFIYLDIIKPKQREEGAYIKKELKPLFNRVMLYLKPYLACGFAKSFREQTILNLEKIYKNKDSTDFNYKKIIDNADNYDFSYHYAWFQIYAAYQNYHPVLWDSQEDNELKRLLLTKIAKFIVEDQENIDEVLWDYFYYDKANLVSYLKQHYKIKDTYLD